MRTTGVPFAAGQPIKSAPANGTCKLFADCARNTNSQCLLRLRCTLCRAVTARGSVPKIIQKNQSIRVSGVVVETENVAASQLPKGAIGQAVTCSAFSSPIGLKEIYSTVCVREQ